MNTYAFSLALSTQVFPCTSLAFHTNFHRQSLVFNINYTGNMTWSLNSMPRQDGRITFITGANSGLGFQAACAYLKR